MKKLPINRMTLAGAAATLVVAAAVVVGLGATRSGAAAASDGSAELGEARQSSVTVALPAPVSEKIYGAEQARGRPIVVIDAVSDANASGATCRSGMPDCSSGSDVSP